MRRSRVAGHRVDDQSCRALCQSILLEVHLSPRPHRARECRPCISKGHFSSDILVLMFDDMRRDPFQVHGSLFPVYDNCLKRPSAP
mmetsp:Transcript_22765/g.59990  ORF Transcript_22765/g.59990 Transcript_22765/m.59990 type:complete len:86 (-) Transcript_22765:59-316(-)